MFDERPNAWWSILCLVRGAVPALQVVNCLQRIPPHAVPASHHDDDDDDINDAGPRHPLSRACQRAFLNLLNSDPIISLLGLPPRYRRSLLKRLLVEVEQQRLPVAEELINEYAEAVAEGSVKEMAVQDDSGSGGGGAGWLFKTFAYGPAVQDAGAAASVATADDSSGQSVSEVVVALDFLSPPPHVVTERHVACLAAALRTGWLGRNVAPAAAQAAAAAGNCENVESSLWRGSHPGAHMGVGVGCRGEVLERQLQQQQQQRVVSTNPQQAPNHEDQQSAGADSPCATAAARQVGSFGPGCEAPERLAATPLGAAMCCHHDDGDGGAPEGTRATGADAAGTCQAARCQRGSGQGPGREQWGLVTLRVSDNLLAGSTGCHEWEASFALAQWVLGRPELFKDRRVLELGCGSGLVAATLARVGAALVAATDGAATAVANCATNLQLNGLEPRQLGGVEELAGVSEGLVVAPLGWEESLPAGGLPAEVVVASDVLYDPDVVPIFVALLQQLLGARADVAYVATLRRNPATLELFLSAAGTAGLRVEVIEGWTAGQGSSGGDVVFHYVVPLEDSSVLERLVLHRIVRQSERH